MHQTGQGYELFVHFFCVLFCTFRFGNIVVPLFIVLRFTSRHPMGTTNTALARSLQIRGSGST